MSQRAEQPSPLLVIPAVPTKRLFRRKRAITALGAVLCLLLTVPASPQSAPVCPGPVYPISGAGEAITVSSTAIGFTTANITNGGNPAIRADCSIATDNIRYRVDNIDPSATVGVLILSTAGQFSVCGEQTVKQFKAIRQTTDAALFCQYFSRVP